MISKKYAQLVFVTIMGLSMSAIMSFAFTAFRSGFNGSFFVAWMESFILGGIIAIPTAMVVAPLAQKLVRRITVAD
ncbi:DUF2798 domain-containing protein [Motiliproteus sp. MSK22-1]|uniref:DUF2798 domain-containing protein n=1 Tax=Motiliproteus sp. MSK22-1 TaxID=1897630 RepID=UPI000976C26F|nr:DUF2798 domain-containing protein [Motiliproteus sp. MSK22-1]OMH33986.1 hypothetical protein BGP75_13565 [Motiliproteus sp. MSK22-1]